MTRRLSIAMAFSAAIHLAALVIVDRLLLSDFTPSVISTPLLVSIVSPGVPAQTATKDPPAPREQPPAVALPSEPAMKTAETAPPGPQEELSAVAAPSESVVKMAAAIGPSVDVPDSDPAVAVLVTDGLDAEWSVPARAALSDEQ